MTFNTVDKLQFLSFILAVLLSIIVHFIAHKLGRAIMHQCTKILLKLVQMIFRYNFLDLPDGIMAIGHHVKFLKA